MQKKLLVTSAYCTKHLNITVNYLDAKKSARCGQVLVVTKLVVMGTQRTTFLQGNTVSVTVFYIKIIPFSGR